jgi:hypothetical protein
LFAIVLNPFLILRGHFYAFSLYHKICEKAREKGVFFLVNCYEFNAMALWFLVGNCAKCRWGGEAFFFGAIHRASLDESVRLRYNRGNQKYRRTYLWK